MDYKRWFVIETQLRADGDVNFLKTEKNSVAAALSYYYARKSAYIVDTTYVKAGVMVCDAELKVIEQDVVTTQYVAPTEG